MPKWRGAFLYVGRGSNPRVATVADGVVHAVAAGTANITATANWLLRTKLIRGQLGKNSKLSGDADSYGLGVWMIGW